MRCHVNQHLQWMHSICSWELLDAAREFSRCEIGCHFRPGVYALGMLYDVTRGGVFMLFNVTRCTVLGNSGPVDALAVHAKVARYVLLSHSRPRVHAG